MKWSKQRWFRHYRRQGLSRPQASKESVRSYIRGLFGLISPEEKKRIIDELLTQAEKEQIARGLLE